MLKSGRMKQSIFLRWVLPALIGVVAGFLALAWAVTSEASLPVGVVLVFSPGLKVAELLLPSGHESLAWTFGWFLRAAIGVNAIFYFAIFAFVIYVAGRGRPKSI